MIDDLGWMTDLNSDEDAGDNRDADCDAKHEHQNHLRHSHHCSSPSTLYIILQTS